MSLFLFPIGYTVVLDHGCYATWPFPSIKKYYMSGLIIMTSYIKLGKCFNAAFDLGNSRYS